MTEFNDHAIFSAYAKFFLQKINSTIWTLEHFHSRKARWGLVGALEYDDYFSEQGHRYCYDIVAGADTKAELLMHCALRGIEISRDD